MNVPTPVVRRANKLLNILQSNGVSVDSIEFTEDGGFVIHTDGGGVHDEGIGGGTIKGVGGGTIKSQDSDDEDV